MTLTDKQKQDIEKEAEKLFIQIDGTMEPILNLLTTHLLTLNRKDEEIERLNKELNNLGAEWNLQKEEIARLRKALDRIAKGRWDNNSESLDDTDMANIATEALKQ